MKINLDGIGGCAVGISFHTDVARDMLKNLKKNCNMKNQNDINRILKDLNVVMELSEVICEEILLNEIL